MVAKSPQTEPWALAGPRQAPGFGHQDHFLEEGRPPEEGRQRGVGSVKGQETRVDVLGVRERGQEMNLKEFTWLEGGV